ncbi:MAG TPA: cache domain-containing protein, partial [Spirochaetota bacterium]|nr:cache domain-containing protein [Spirochaetota bacterium]
MNRLQAACRALIIWDVFMKKTDRIRKTLSAFINPISAIILITCLAVGIFHAASRYYINMLFDRVESQYRQGSINIVSVARNSIEPILKKVRSREISRQEAIERIRPIIRNMTYNDQAGKNYILMTTY